MDLDLKEYTGELMDSAAEGQQIGSNSYQREQLDGEPVYKEFLEPVKDTTPVMEKSEAIQEPSKQELNFKALREEVDRIKQERDSERNEYKLNLELLKANMQPKQAEAQKPIFEGLSKTDIPNVGDVEKVFMQREAEYQARIEELQVAQRYPDYAEVMEKHLTPLLKQKPHLAEGIQGARNKAQYAYELGKMWQERQQPAPQPTTSQPHPIAQRIVENAKRPGPIAQASGTSVLSQADYYATMSDADFYRFAQKNLGEI